MQVEKRQSIQQETEAMQKEENLERVDGLERYGLLEKIGEGTYGVVYKGYDSIDQRYVAIKKVKLEADDTEGIPQTSLREISILKSLDTHPNLVKLDDIIYNMEEKKLFLIFEYMDYDLKKYLSITKSISPHSVKLIMYQLLCGLNSCHKRRIIHRDLKPQNILVDKAGNIKITDFGLARIFTVPTKTLTHEVETLWYRAPEILLGVKTYSLGVDMWSLGCIFFELVAQMPLFMSDSEIDAIFKIFQLHGTPDHNTFPGLSEYPYFKTKFPRFKKQDPQVVFDKFSGDSLDLLMKMIALDPADRISVKDAMNHPYFCSLTDLEKQTYNSENNSELLFEFNY